jgi:hypothetical protein
VGVVSQPGYPDIPLPDDHIEASPSPMVQLGRYLEHQGPPPPALTSEASKPKGPGGGVAEGAGVGVVSSATDVDTTGSTSGYIPQPPLTSEQPNNRSISSELGIGAQEGLKQVVVDSVVQSALLGLTGGASAWVSMGESIAEGYQDQGIAGALNAVNPLYPLALNGTQAYLAFVDGDYQAAARIAVPTLALAVAMAVPVGKLVGAVGKGEAAVGAGAAEGVGANAARGGAHLNGNAAVSRFGIYEIRVNNELYKVGKADMNRTTQSSGLPTRLHQQWTKLSKIYGDRVEGQVVEPLGETTTAQAKAAEAARIRAVYEETGKVPPGNQRSFKP